MLSHIVEYECQYTDQLYKKRNLEQRAKISLVNSITPIAFAEDACIEYSDDLDGWNNDEDFIAVVI